MSDPVDVIRKFFINGEGELRSGWRVIVFFIIYIILLSLLSGGLSILVTLIPSLGFLTTGVSQGEEHLDNPELISVGLGQLLNLAAALVASWACARLLEHRSLASIGYKLHRGWLRDFSLGSLLGAASIALAVAIAASAGAVKFDINTYGGATKGATNGATLALAFMILFLLFLLSGAFEEILFRGFAFQALVHNIGAVAAILITSTLFGLAHLSNANSSAFSTINTILAGVWLGVAYMVTRSLWLATALHYSWNFVMVFVFGLPVSGMTLFNQLAWLRGQSGPPEWISGGEYGPEGGAAATLVLIVATLVIWKSGLFKPSEEMLMAIQHGNQEPRLKSIAPDSQGKNQEQEL
jgi:membrane protease YdiL (CAAX protease family)